MGNVGTGRDEKVRVLTVLKAASGASHAWLISTPFPAAFGLTADRSCPSPCSSGAVPDGVEGVKRGVIGVREGVEVLLGRCNPGVSKPFLYDLEVGPAGEEP